MGGLVEGGQREGGSGQGSRFEMQTFGLQVAEVMEAIPPELDSTGRAVYLALFWRAYGQGESWCQVSQEALAAACGVTRKTVKAAMKALAIARLVTVEQAGTKSHATRYKLGAPHATAYEDPGRRRSGVFVLLELTRKGTADL